MGERCRVPHCRIDIDQGRDQTGPSAPKEAVGEGPVAFSSKPDEGATTFLLFLFLRRVSSPSLPFFCYEEQQEPGETEPFPQPHETKPRAGLF